MRQKTQSNCSYFLMQENKKQLANLQNRGREIEVWTEIDCHLLLHVFSNYPLTADDAELFEIIEGVSVVFYIHRYCITCAVGHLFNIKEVAESIVKVIAEKQKQEEI